MPSQLPETVRNLQEISSSLDNGFTYRGFISSNDELPDISSVQEGDCYVNVNSAETMIAHNNSWVNSNNVASSLNIDENSIITYSTNGSTSYGEPALTERQPIVREIHPQLVELRDNEVICGNRYFTTQVIAPNGRDANGRDENSNFIFRLSPTYCNGEILTSIYKPTEEEKNDSECYYRRHTPHCKNLFPLAVGERADFIKGYIDRYLERQSIREAERLSAISSEQ